VGSLVGGSAQSFAATGRDIVVDVEVSKLDDTTEESEVDEVMEEELEDDDAMEESEVDDAKEEESGVGVAVGGIDESESGLVSVETVSLLVEVDEVVGIRTSATVATGCTVVVVASVIAKLIFIVPYPSNSRNTEAEAAPERTLTPRSTRGMT